MADYHMLGDSVFGVAGSGLMDDTQNMVGAGSYGHNTSMNVSGPGMMSQNMPMAPSQNPGNMIQGMVGMQQAQPVQSGSQMPPGSMGSYHQGSVHGYSQNEVPQKLHQYAGYGSQLQPSGSASGQYMTAGPRLHHMGDAMASPAPSQQQQQQQQPTPRAMVANQMAYQSRNMSGNHYGQQMMHSNAAPTQITPNPAQYSNQYASVPHHQYQQHSIQQVNQGADVWQSSMTHPQMSRQCIPQAQSYPPHQTLPSQHGNNSMTLSPLAMQSQRPSTPNQSQYVAGPDYPVQHPSAQTVQMQRSPVYNLNSSTVNQNGTHIVQGSGPSQSGIPQAYSSIPQNEQGITFPQGHYTPPTQAAPNRPHYIPSSTAGSTVTQSPQQHLVGQQPMIGMRPSMHQLGYSPVSSRVNSGQQHTGTLPPGSPARVQPQYHPPFSPNQGYPPSAQPSPRSVTGETATPPHIPHYSQSVAQSPTSPQYRSQFPTQLTQSPQHLAATPPAEASAPTSSCTPDRSHHSTPVPQSQGSFPSPSTTHMTSPGQGQSPGNSGTPSNSLQHLEQMVMPHVSSVTSTSNVTNAVASGSPAMSHNSVMGGNYYAHLHTQSQHHQTHMSSANETRPQPLSPVVSHVSTQQHSHLGYMGPGVSIGQQQQQPPPLQQPPQQSQPQLQQQQQPQQQSQQQSSIVTPSVSQSVPPIVSAMNALTKSSTPDDDGSLLDLDSSQNNSLMGYSPISNNQEVISQDGMITLPQPVASTPTLPPSVPPPPAPANHMGPVSNSNSQPMQIPPHQYGTGHNQYQSNVTVPYEMQKIQHEIQQMNGPNQTPESQEKLKVLQERLRYLQGQSNESGPPDSIPMNVHIGGMSSQYPRPPMVYGNTGPPSYMHQQSMQPHPMHYNPSGPPVRQERPMPVLGPQTNHMMNDLYSSANASSCGSLEQDSVENVIPPNYPPLVPEAVPSMMPANMPPIDPYEMTFNDEPPKKMKRRTPKEPKEPKPPKEKKPPKPKKPKKPKNDTSMPPLLEGAYGPLPENGEQVANPEPGSELPPANLDMPMNPEVPEKKKKNRKRKTKEKENDEPSAEPKEPKPKKPRRKSPKQPKQPKVPKDAEATVVSVEKTEGDSAVIAESAEVQDLPEGAEPPIEEGGEVKSEKKKEKKESKSKSPKTPGSSKEGGGSKKSTPKKKLPKIALRFTSKKKKKKPLGASDIENSDMEKTPPPSPEDGEGKRRSARNTNRKKYTDDIELHLSDDTIELEFGQSPILNSEGKVVQVVMDSHNEDHMVVEKILATRSISKPLEEKPGSDGENSNSVIDSVEVEEYYVKYKNLSYIHCEWKTLEELEQGDRRFLQKVKRYKQKKAEFNFFDFLEDEPFNPDYIEVDRVLDVNEIPEFLVSEGAKQPETLKSEVDETEGEQPEKSINQDAEAADQSTAETVKTEAEELETNPELSSNENEEEFKAADIKEEVKTLETLDENKPELSPPLLEMPDITASENTNNNESSESSLCKKEPKNEADSADQEIKTEEGENVDKTEEGENVDKTEDGENVDKTEDGENVDKTEDGENVDKTEEGENIDKTEEGENVDKTEEGENIDKTEGENVDKIEEKPGKVTRHYLVKWRALTYEESTWELEEDVDRSRIEQFERFRYPPPKEKWKVKKKPKYSEWDKIEGIPVYKGENTLREYQLEGVNWLTFCWYNQQNCILADEMGLGKTIQSIAFLNEIDKYGIPGPFLIIAPLSTIGNWQREFETWTDLNTITYHGSSPSRNMILEYEMYWKNEKGERIQEVYKFQVLITTFEIILTDCLELRAIPWRCVIIDEAHRLKNRNCKLLEGLRLLNTEHRVLLTGTPLQNNVEELFSLLNFLEPNRFASTEAFLEEFGDLKTEAQVDKLKALLKPMMLRRLKEDVEKSLAPKEETVIEVELTNIQKKYYRAILERNFTFLTKGNCYSNIPNLMNTMMELRKCCIHPFLINGAEEQIISDYKIHHEEVVEAQLNAMVQASGKLVLIDKLLPRLREGGHRVLVFSQMVKCLDILEDYMVQKRYPYERIDGRVRGNLRQAAIDRFCKPDSDRFVFLLCTRAGGLGINLTAADTVIIFDSDWNPQNDLQAQARCHRIGQSKAVKVYRLICRNTYEREMFDKASLKLGLDKAVLQSMNPSKENIGMNQQMSKKEIEDLLRKGAYGALMEDDNAGDKFCEEDIDQILQRRTQVIHVESGVQGSTFSKATFASASTRSDIEIDDPNFWEKWAKKANLDVDELKSRNELIIQEPRRRTQTRRFGTDDHMMDLSDLETSDDDDENVSARTRAGKRCTKLGRIRPKNRGRALDREKDEEYMEDIAPGNWTRAECFKVEKGLLTFGWGRWDECIALGQFRRPLSHKDCEHISRTILLYCLLHYKGDEKIKSFIWDLICPTYDGEQPIHRNHSEVEIVYEKEGVLEGLSADEKGLSAPVPRGRKGKKIKKEIKAVDTVIEESEWAKEEQYNPDVLLNDEAYRKHLNRHANKVLLRVRLLYYLKHEIIGDLHLQVFSGIPASLIPLEVPPADGEPPSPWWDREVDKSLLLGIYKHGFERYNLMRQDPSLCFLSRCGPPDGAALWAELNANAEDLAEQANQEEVAEKEGKFSFDKELDELEPLSPSSESHSSKTSLDQSRPFTQPSLERINALMSGIPIFPSVTDVNTRVRRLITAYQRNNKKLEIRNAQKARLVALTLQKMERREKFEAAIREREMKKRELQQRKWSRREEADFYRTISAFGVEYTEDKKDYNWSRFRNLARLERKYDETLAEYYKSFYAMCKRVCGKKLTEEEEQLSFVVDPISEDRASRCLQRVDLLHKIREEILSYPELDERLKLCQPSMDLPDWWQCGKHDKDLLIGAAKHGLSRMDYHLLHDSTLSFKEVVKNHPHAKLIQIGSHMSTPIGCSSPAMTCLSTEETPVKDDVYSSGGGVKEEVKLSLLQKLEESVEKTPQKEQSTSESERSVARKLLDSSMEEMDVDKTENIEKDLSVNAKAIQEHPKKEEELDTLKNEAIPELEDQTQPLKEKTESLIIVESKVEDECKAEDEETDIETDIKRDEEHKESAQEKTVNDVTIKTEPESNSLEPPVLEEQEKCEQKYECDTDTELKAAEETEIKDPNLKGDAFKDKEQQLSLAVQATEQKATTVVKEEIKVEEKKKESVIKEVKEECQSLIDDQNDEVMSQASFNLEGELGEPTVAQLLAITNGNTVRWPKDKVLQIRLEHIVQAVEKNEWPVIRPLFLANFPGVPSTSIASASNTPAPRTASPSPHRSSPAPSLTSRDGHSRDATPLATPEPPPIRESVLPELPITPVDFNMLNKSPVQPPSSGSGGDAVKHRRRRRRRRFEIEAERAKLRQLLSHNMQQQQQQHQQQLHHVQQFLASTNSSLLRSKAWDDHVDDKLQLPSVVPPPVLVPSPLPPPTVASSTAAAPPPAHQNSSPRLSTTLGSLDLRVKSSVTPVSFASVLPPPKPPIPQPAEDLSKSAGSPSSPMDLSASAGFCGQASSSGGSSAKSMVRARIKEGRSSKGGSRIDALALNLQARKQQQLMQEQHHGLPLDPLLTSEHSERIKDPIEPEISAHSHIRHHHHSQHQEKRNPEEEETKLRRKRLQYSEEAVRKSLNRAFEMARAPPAHSSFLNTSLSSNLTGSSSRLHLGPKHDDQHNNATNPLLDHSGLMHHDFKKWLEEHPELVATNPNLVAAAAAAMAFNPIPSFPSHTELLELPEGRRRGRRPRLDPTKLDFDKVTGEENVSVINRLTGKKITGSKAPPLKHLTEWLDKNPMFDVDPKWGQLVREKGNLPKNMMARIVTPSEKRGRRTAAALLASAHQNLVTPPSTMSFPSASSLNPLSFANAGMLAGFPNMNFFKDPPKVTSTLSSTTTTVATSSSNPPIFLPFGGLAGMGLTNPLFGFPGFNFPGLQGASPLGSSSLSSKEQGKDNEKSSKSDKASDIGSSSRKNLPVSTSSVSASSIMSGSGMPSATSLPFLYPAPSLLYNPLGLGNFALPPNLPASFASFSQSGLVNGLGLNSPLITTNPMNTTSATSLVSSPLTSTIPLTSHAPLGSSIISKLSSNMPSSKHSPSHSSALETQDTDEESLKSLMGTHDADDEDDMDEGKLENYDNLEKDDSDRDFTGKSPIFSTGRNSTKVSESESENIHVSKNPSLRPVVDNIQSNKTKGVSDDPTSDSTDTESKNS